MECMDSFTTLIASVIVNWQLERQLRELQAQFDELQTAFTNKDLEVILFKSHNLSLNNMNCY